MEKLVSLASFQKKAINKKVMQKIKGGIDIATGAGTRCVSTAVSSSGCSAFSSDHYCCGGEFWAYETTGDVNQPCTA